MESTKTETVIVTITLAKPKVLSDKMAQNAIYNACKGKRFAGMKIEGLQDFKNLTKSTHCEHVYTSKYTGNPLIEECEICGHLKRI